jgi:hypothetical protein
VQEAMKTKTVTREKKKKEVGHAKRDRGVDPALVRSMVRAQFEEARAKGLDIAVLRDSLCRRFTDPAVLAVIEEEYRSCAKKDGEDEEKRSPAVERNQLQGAGDADVSSAEKDTKHNKPEETGSEIESRAESDAKKASEQKPSEAREQGKKEDVVNGEGEDLKPKKGVKGDTKKGSKVEPLALQDIKLASLPVGGKLPGFAESLHIDLQKYAQEKAYHDAWNLKPAAQLSTGERLGLVGKAIGRGAITGLAQGFGDALLDFAIHQGAKRIPYVSGVAEIAAVMFDPKAWLQGNIEGTWGKMKKGVGDIFGGGKDFVTRVEGLINLLDGIANALGLLGSICQVVAGVLFAGGLILSLLGVGAGLIAAAPFFLKAGLVLGEISTLMKIGTTALRTVVIAGRTYQILTDKSSDPETLQKRIESLEKATSEYASTFAKAKTKKLTDKWDKGSSSGKTAKGKQKTREDSSNKSKPKVSQQALPDKPKRFFERAKNLGAGIAKEALTGGQWEKVQDFKQRGLKGTLEPEKRRKELEDELKKTKEKLRGARISRTKREQGIARIESELKSQKERYKNLQQDPGRGKELSKLERDIQKKERYLAQKREELKEVVSRVQGLEKKEDRLQAELASVKGWLDKIAKAEEGKKSTGLSEGAKSYMKQGANWLVDQVIAIPRKLPEPPVQDELEVDRQAEIYAELCEQIGQIEFQKKTLQEMQKDAEIEKTGLDVLNKLAQANLAQAQSLKKETEETGFVLNEKEKQVRGMEDANSNMRSGPGARTGEYTSFLARLANLLGMVPSKLAPKAQEGAQRAKQGTQAVQQFEQTRETTGSFAQGTKAQVQQDKKTLSVSNQKVEGTEASLAKTKAEILAKEAGLVEGKTFILQGLKLADQKKAEKELERKKAEEEYLSAKKRLLSWAILHEDIRKGEEASLESSLEEAEKMLADRK